MILNWVKFCLAHWLMISKRSWRLCGSFWEEEKPQVPSSGDFSLRLAIKLFLGPKMIMTIIMTTMMTMTRTNSAEIRPANFLAGKKFWSPVRLWRTVHHMWRTVHHQWRTVHHLWRTVHHLWRTSENLMLSAQPNVEDWSRAENRFYHSEGIMMAK